MSESRAFTRIPVHIDVEVRPEGGSPVSGVVHDLSFNGVSVDAPGNGLEKGAECEIELILDGGATELRLPGHGRVVRAGDLVVALSFSALDGDVYEHFERLVLLNADNPNEVMAELEDHADDQPRLREPIHD